MRQQETGKERKALKGDVERGLKIGRDGMGNIVWHAYILWIRKHIYIVMAWKAKLTF